MSVENQLKHSNEQLNGLTIGTLAMKTLFVCEMNFQGLNISIVMNKINECIRRWGLAIFFLVQIKQLLYI